MRIWLRVRQQLLSPRDGPCDIVTFLSAGTGVTPSKSALCEEEMLQKIAATGPRAGGGDHLLNTVSSQPCTHEVMVCAIHDVITNVAKRTLAQTIYIYIHCGRMTVTELVTMSPLQTQRCFPS